MFTKAIVRTNVKLDDVKPHAQPTIVEVCVCAQFTNKQEFIVREHMLQ